MDTQSIQQIRSFKNQCLENLKKIKTNDYIDQKFGPENEYTAKTLVSSITDILKQVTAFTKSHAKFVRSTNLGERNIFANQLSRLNTNLANRNLQQVSLELDELKPLIRSYELKFLSGKTDAYQEFVESLSASSSELAEKTDAVNKLVAQNDEVLSELKIKNETLVTKIKSVEESEQSLLLKISGLETKSSSLEGLLASEQEKAEAISSVLSDVTGKSSAVDSFSKRVSTREAQLEDQETKTTQYMERLKTFSAERQDYINEAKELIKNAKLALEYKTAEGLSAAFQTRQSELDKAKSWLWLCGAMTFVVAIILISWLLLSGDKVGLNITLSRITLVPMLAGGAWFCAGQYVKKQNISEDYAFKTALAKSMVGFSEQLSNSDNKGEVYNHFVKSTLNQIHKDPLRKHSLKAQEMHSDARQVDIQNIENKLMQFIKNTTKFDT